MEEKVDKENFKAVFLQIFTIFISCIIIVKPELALADTFSSMSLLIVLLLAFIRKICQQIQKNF